MADKTGKSCDRQRTERLKAALRANLKRRKAQARGRGEGPGSGSPPAQSGESGKPGSRSQS